MDVTITIDPTGKIVEGDPVKLTCVISGGNPTTALSYSWRYEGVVIPAATGRTLERNPILYNQGGTYTCTATNVAGPSSATKGLNVLCEYDRSLVPTNTHRCSQHRDCVELGSCDPCHRVWGLKFCA